MTTNIYKTPFKTCTMCQASWNTCQQFVEDHSLKLNGYFADFEDPREGLIMVTHHAEGCLAVPSAYKQKIWNICTPVRNTPAVSLAIPNVRATVRWKLISRLAVLNVICVGFEM